MLDRIREIILKNPNRESFFRYVNRRFPQSSVEFALIEKAYNLAKDEFQNDKREGPEAERYFEHLRSVALIIMIYLRVRDPEIIAAALLHDLVEDKPYWTESLLAEAFGRTVAQYVYWVTKPDIKIFDGDKEARNREYHQNLNHAPRAALIIKLADRLHNLVTLWGLDEDKQRRKVRETQDFYLSLAEKEIILVHEIEEALSEIMRAWKTQT